MSPKLRLLRAAAYTIEMSRRAVFAHALGGGVEAARDITRQWAVGLCARMDIEVVAEGMDRIDWSRPVLIMANHQSYLDVLALYRTLPQPFGMIAKKALHRIPFFGGVMDALGCVSIDRGKHEQAVEALERAAAEVRAGKTIAIFPEGTRSPGDRIRQLKKGPFHLAQAAQVPIVPIGIRGSAVLMPRTNTGIRPGRIEVHVGDPIPAIARGSDEARAALATRVREELARLAAVPVLDE